MALCTQTDVERILQIDFDIDPDPHVSALIGYAQALVEKHCRRTFEAEAGLVATLDGPGKKQIWLPKTPITAINSITEEGTALTADQYKWYASGKVVRVVGDYDYVWTWKRQAIVVDYDGGYSTIPEDIEYACAKLAAIGFEQGAAFATQDETHGINLERIGDYMAQYDLESARGAMHINDELRKILAPYRRTIVTGAD